MGAYGGRCRLCGGAIIDGICKGCGNEGTSGGEKYAEKSCGICGYSPIPHWASKCLICCKKGF